ncbi:hypothetical protein BH23CHL8_BH23CHL8_09710 [soil metagenome]
MNMRTILAAALTAALALAGLATVVTAQDTDTESLTGTVVAVTNADGGTDTFLEVADGTQIKLAVGPHWYWSEGDPLAPHVGQVVTVEGHHSDGLPDDQAADIARERAVEEASFEVRLIDGTAIWTTARPPWAGGPAVVGEAHPGFAGWSRGQERNAAGDANAEERAGGPAVVGESHPGYKGWSKGQAVKVAKLKVAKVKALKVKALRGNAGGPAAAAQAEDR